MVIKVFNADYSGTFANCEFNLILEDLLRLMVALRNNFSSVRCIIMTFKKKKKKQCRQRQRHRPTVTWATAAHALLLPAWPHRCWWYVWEGDTVSLWPPPPPNNSKKEIIVQVTKSRQVSDTNPGLCRDWNEIFYHFPLYRLKTCEQA